MQVSGRFRSFRLLFVYFRAHPFARIPDNNGNTPINNAGAKQKIAVVQYLYDHFSITGRPALTVAPNERGSVPAGTHRKMYGASVPPTRTQEGCSSEALGGSGSVRVV